MKARYIYLIIYIFLFFGFFYISLISGNDNSVVMEDTSNCNKCIELRQNSNNGYNKADSLEIALLKLQIEKTTWMSEYTSQGTFYAAVIALLAIFAGIFTYQSIKSKFNEEIKSIKDKTEYFEIKAKESNGKLIELNAKTKLLDNKIAEFEKKIIKTENEIDRAIYFAGNIFLLSFLTNNESQIFKDDSLKRLQYIVNVLHIFYNKIKVNITGSAKLSLNYEKDLVIKIKNIMNEYNKDNISTLTNKQEYYNAMNFMQKEIRKIIFLLEENDETKYKDVLNDIKDLKIKINEFIIDNIILEEELLDLNEE